MHLENIKTVADNITSITIQGATNIAKAGIEILGKEINNQKCTTIKEFDLFFLKAIKMLQGARETEPMLFNGLNMCRVAYAKLLKEKTSLKNIQTALYKICKNYVQDIQTEELIRPLIGAKILKKGSTIMTHCHSGSVIKILTTAHKQNKKIQVYNTETRPLYQGRKTSADLIKAGVPDTMITDGAAPFFVDNVYENDVTIDVVLIGSDAIKITGDVYNKVGSFAIALSAWHSGIPVYVIGSLLKVDMENTVKIEQRSGQETREDAPKGLKILNYAFDMIPAKFITGIVTEYGIIKPKDIKKSVKKYYPWMLSATIKK